MIAVLRHTVFSLLRDPGVLLLMLGMAATAALAAFVGRLSLLEGSRGALALAAPAVRLGMALALLGLATAHMERLRLGRELEAMVAWPVPRLVLAAGLVAGLAAVVPPMGTVAVLTLVVLGASGNGLWLWGLTLGLEGVVILALGVTCSIAFGRTAALLAGGATYALFRTGTVITELLDQRLKGETGPLDAVLGLVGRGIGSIVPHLDHLARTTWLTGAASAEPEGVMSNAIWPALAQGLAAVAVLIALAGWALDRRVRL